MVNKKLRKRDRMIRRLADRVSVLLGNGGRPLLEVEIQNFLIENDCILKPLYYYKNKKSIPTFFVNNSPK